MWASRKSDFLYARTEAIEEGNKEAEYCMMEGEGGYLLKKEREHFDGSYLSSGGTGSTIRMYDSHSYLVLSHPA